MGKVPGTYNDPENNPNMSPREQVEAEIAKEFQEWAKKGMNPNGVQFTVWQMDCMIAAITDIMEERLEVPREELDLAFRKRILANLRIWRKEFEDSPIAVPQRQILGPDGRGIQR